MPKKRFTVEQIIKQLREAEVELAHGKTIGLVCKQLGIAGQTTTADVRITVEFVPTRSNVSKTWKRKMHA
ncbi:hypothetical protein [Gimesia sp.]|uniref:hypothetical protein n=1 Tax=Gimesia sp. TaxID=2024833 RepID=UPI0032EFF0E5